MQRPFEIVKEWARGVKRDVIALWLAAGDRRTPLIAKIFAAVVAAYALSPIDLIPDFIPVLGLLDDLILVPLGISLAVRMIPPELMSEFRNASMEMQKRPTSRLGLFAILAIWALLITTATWATWAHLLRFCREVPVRTYPDQ